MKLGDWIDERTGYRQLVKSFVEATVPGGARFAYAWGTALGLMLMVVAVTGVLLSTVYAPSATTASGWTGSPGRPPSRKRPISISRTPSTSGRYERPDGTRLPAKAVTFARAWTSGCRWFSHQGAGAWSATLRGSAIWR